MSLSNEEDINTEKLKQRVSMIRKESNLELKEKLESTWCIHPSKNVLNNVDLTDYHEDKGNLTYLLFKI